MSKEADLITSSGKTGTAAGNWGAISVKHNGSITECGLTNTKGYVTEGNIMLTDNSMRSLLMKQNEVVNRKRTLKGMESTGTEQMAVFNLKGKAYVRHEVSCPNKGNGGGGVSVLIPSKTNELTPFQKDFVEAIKQGYLPENYNFASWGTKGSLDFGDLAKGIYEFLHKTV